MIGSSTVLLRRRIPRLQLQSGHSAKLLGMDLCTPVSIPFPEKWIELIDIVTGICLAEAAISILRDEHKLSGGIYTPATLGQKFIDRLEVAGMRVEKKFFEN